MKLQNNSKYFFLDTNQAIKLINTNQALNVSISYIPPTSVKSAYNKYKN